METPSSIGRVTRSQTSSLHLKKTKQEEESSRSINNGNHERFALQDISNDSPINGVAMEKTPLSSVIKNCALSKQTPGSGEALLRGQVKILLEKVEEEAELVNKISNRHSAPFVPFLGVLPISPMLLAAPTPANTPQFFNSFKAKEEAGDNSAIGVGVAIENVPIVLPKHEEHLEPQECVINRALLFDSPSKSESSDVFSNISSSVTYQGSIVSSSFDDNSSNWSIQANASAYEDDEEDYIEEFEEEEEEEEEDYCEENEEEKECLDELCEKLERIKVEDKEMKKKIIEFEGKHTRFIYDSDDEIEREEEIDRARSAGKAVSPSLMLLKGLPLPEGKHIRFHEEDEE